MISIQGNLTCIGLNSTTPRIFINGNEVPFISQVKVDWEADEQRVKLKVTQITPELLTSLTAAGVLVKVSK